MTAVLSDNRQYRYRLTREFGHLGDSCCFIMLNPSTADETQDDPTIRRCKGFAARFGRGTLEVVNLFAWRATNPRDLIDSCEAGIDIIGPENDRHIVEAVNAATLVICAWGNHGTYGGRNKAVLDLIRAQGVVPKALRINAKSLQPAHPLYLPGGLTPMEIAK